MNRALYAYIPVVHTGVLDMLNAHQGVPLWLLDTEKGKQENVYLERDMRALSASQIQKELEALGYTNIHIVDHNTLGELTKFIDELLVPNDEIVTYFVEKFAPNVPVQRVSMFLRWTKPISVAEYEIPNNRIITTDLLHREILEHLEEEAAKSSDWWRQIGAMITKDGKPLAITHNAHLPTSHSVLIHGDPRSNLDAGQGPGVYTSIHAEAAAIAETARKGLSTEGSDIYVTTFPCPTCARLLVQAGIKNVYYRKGYSLLDAEEILNSAGVRIILVQDDVTQPE